MYTGDDERVYIYKLFQTGLRQYANRRVALYGLGVNTEYILEQPDHLPIVALMDQAREGENVFGLPVLSADMAKTAVDVIVIVARSVVVPVIYERIRHLEADGILIVDVAGNPVGNGPESEMANNPYWESSYEDLLAAIDAHDVISFDLFDTLVMRKVLRPSDLYEVVERFIQADGYPVAFQKIRMEAEKQAYAELRYPTYDDIYVYFHRLSGLPKEDCAVIQQCEFETELLYLTPRKRVAEAMAYAVSNGKPVFIVSDMYFTVVQLEKILSHHGIQGYQQVIVSSEAKAGKWPNGDLFRHYLDLPEVPVGKKLHIGDNPGADLEGAQKQGIDTFYVMNPYEMLVASELRQLLVHVKTIEDKIVLGMFAACMLNDPFALCAQKGKLYIDDFYKVGYAIFGPMLVGYVFWLLKEYAGKQDTHKILFLARDGYIVEKLYQKMVEAYHIEDAPQGLYVLASRRALAVAALFDEEDLAFYVDRIDIEAPCRVVLEQKFGIKPREGDENADTILEDETLREYIFTYKKEILEQASTERNEYLQYLREVGVEREDHLVVFDSLTLGTCAYYFNGLVPNKVILRCMQLINVPDYSVYSGIDAEAYLGESTYYLPSAFIKLRPVVENVFASEKGQFVKFLDKNPLYSKMESGQVHFERITGAAHRGIEKFCEEFIVLMKRNMSLSNIDGELIKSLTDVLLVESAVYDKKIEGKLRLENLFTGTSVAFCNGKEITVKLFTENQS